MKPKDTMRGMVKGMTIKRMVRRTFLTVLENTQALSQTQKGMKMFLSPDWE